MRGGSPTLIFDRSGTGSAELYFDDNGFKIFQGQPAGGGGSTEVVSITNDGNVGINSTAPTSKLDVDGDVKISGFSTFSNLVRVVDDQPLIVGTTTSLTLQYNSGLNKVFATNTSDEFIIQGPSIVIQTHGGNKYFTGTSDIAKLYHTNNERLSTTDTGVSITDNLNVAGISTLTGQVGFGTHITLPDTAKAIFGDHEDIQIYNKGNISIIAIQANTTSDNYSLHIYSFYTTTYSSGFSQRFRVGNIYQENNQTGELALELKKDGPVDAYYNGEKRFSTSGIGATVHGQLDTTDLNVSGISTFGGSATFAADGFFKNTAGISIE